MRWWVGILAALTVLISAGSLYFAYTVGMPAPGEVEVLSSPDAPLMTLLTGRVGDVVLATAVAALAALACGFALLHT